MDSLLAKMGTILFWFTAFPIIHLGLKGMYVGHVGESIGLVGAS